MPDMMTIPGIWLWGLLATGLLTTIMRLGQAVHFTRIDMPSLLGTMFTANRDRAKVIGFVLHFMNGWAFAFLYAVFFKQVGFATWWLGGLMGISHGIFVLVVLPPFSRAHTPGWRLSFTGRRRPCCWSHPASWPCTTAIKPRW